LDSKLIIDSILILWKGFLKHMERKRGSRPTVLRSIARNFVEPLNVVNCYTVALPEPTVLAGMLMPTHIATFVPAGIVLHPPALITASVATKTPGLQSGIRNNGVVLVIVRVPVPDGPIAYTSPPRPANSLCDHMKYSPSWSESNHKFIANEAEPLSFRKLGLTDTP
jgi:hypothetical protein